MQVCNIDVKCGINVGETIFSLFLGMPNSRVTSITKLKPRAKKNSTHVQASCTTTRFKNRRLTRQFGKPRLAPPVLMSA